MSTNLNEATPHNAIDLEDVTSYYESELFSSMRKIQHIDEAFQAMNKRAKQINQLYAQRQSDACLPEIVNIQKFFVQLINKVEKNRLTLSVPERAGYFITLLKNVQKKLTMLRNEIGQPQEEAELANQSTQALYHQQALLMDSREPETMLRDVLGKIKKLLQENRFVSKTFISYAWPLDKNKDKEYWLQPFLKILHRHLKAAGIMPVLDIVDNKAGGNIYQFMQQIEVWFKYKPLKVTLYIVRIRC